MGATDFYEDDEPIEDVIAAFDAGEKGVTRPPPGWTGPVRDADEPVPAIVSRTWGRDWDNPVDSLYDDL